MNSIACSVGAADSNGACSARRKGDRTATTYQSAACGAKGSSKTSCREGYRPSWSATSSTVSISDSCGTGRRLVNRDSTRTTDNRCRGGPQRGRYGAVTSSTARTACVNRIARGIGSADSSGPSSAWCKCHRATTADECTAGCAKAAG